MNLLALPAKGSSRLSEALCSLSDSQLWRFRGDFASINPLTEPLLVVVKNHNLIKLQEIKRMTAYLEQKTEAKIDLETATPRERVEWAADLFGDELI